MNFKYKLCLLLISLILQTQRLMAQVAELDNLGNFTTSYLGWDASTTFPLNIRHNNNIANSDINFWTRNTQRMQLNDNGLLGLGLTTQTSLLHLGRTTNSLGSLFRTDGLNNEVTQWQLFTGTTTTSGQTEKYRLWTDASTTPWTNNASFSRGFRWYTDGTALTTNGSNTADNIRMQLQDDNGNITVNGIATNNAGFLLLGNNQADSRFS